jgi:hypothetical protein
MNMRVDNSMGNPSELEVGIAAHRKPAKDHRI